MTIHAILNHIGDDAAKDMQAFYERWLGQNVTGVSLYEAHLYLGLIAWRNTDLQTMQSHFSHASQTIVSIYTERAEQTPAKTGDIFDFIHPLFLVSIFGTETQQQQLALIPTEVCMGDCTPEFESIYLLLKEMKAQCYLSAINVARWHQILAVNEEPITHLFYYDWIRAFTEGVLAIHEKNIDRLENSLETLTEKHREMAMEGDFRQRFEGLVAFWSLALIKLAQKHELSINFQSPYLPEL